MKPLIVGIIIVALIIAGFWAYARYKKNHPSPSTTPTATVHPSPTGTPVVIASQTPTPRPSASPFPTSYPTPINISPTPYPSPVYTPRPAPLPPIGNQPGDTAPDFKLQNTSLHQFRGHTGVIVWLHPYDTCYADESYLRATQSRYPGFTTLIVYRGPGAYGCGGLYDSADALHRLFGTNANSYFIVIDIRGVILETFVHG